MSGGPAAETIMFIAAVLAAGLVAGSLSTVASELSQGMDARGDALHDQLVGRFVIVNDPQNVPTAPLTFYIKNTGTTPFATSGFVVILDGIAETNLEFYVDGLAATEVTPGQLLEIRVIGAAPGNGDHKAIIIAGNGHKEALTFTV